MPAQIIQRGAYRDEFDLRIERAAIQGFGKKESEFDSIYSTLDSRNEDERGTALSGLGLWQQKIAETDSVAIDTPFQGYTWIATHTEYELSYGISMATWEDDKERHALMGERLAADLTNKGHETIEILAAAPFNNAASATGFSPWASSSYGSGYLADGQALLSTAHPLPVGGTFSNTFSTPVAMSTAALQAAEIAMDQTLDYRGLLTPCEAKALVYPIQSKFVARELNRSGSPEIPYTDQNTKNFLDYELKLWRRLNNSTAWFLLAQKAKDMYTKGQTLRYFVRVAPTFRSWVNQDNLVRRGAGRFRISFICEDPRGIFGCSTT